MATSLVQPYVDQENATSVNASSRKSSTSAASRPSIIGKTFSNASSLATPRRAFGDLSNVTSTAKKPSGAIKKGPINRKMPLKKSTLTPSAQSIKKPKAKLIDTTKSAKPEDAYPPIESMHIFEDIESEFELPPEHRLSNMNLFKRTLPIMQTGLRDVDDIVPDFSFLTLHPIERPYTDTSDFTLPSESPLSDQLLDLPSVNDVDILDINSLLKDLEI
ncbi:uncharacterized protein [Antedon mediterranea]|uniref:uncharacterized protein n=1 Tax=Antedon mediterranea TaxID=105859 RepID=UPI003AF70C68